jgi:cytochrome c oxidase cbb3-type subunit 4
MQVIREYVYWFTTLFLVIALYAYILHLYRSEKRGENDYEKYSRMALDDELTDTPVEEHIRKKDVK